MEIKWLSKTLIEVKGARSADEARWFVEQETGRGTGAIMEIVVGLHQVTVL